MIILYAIILGFIAYKWNHLIRKYYELLMAFIIIVGYISLWQTNTFLDLWSSGEIGLAFFLVVMFAGAFERGGTLSKRLRGVRKEYSIFGFFALVPHFMIYLVDMLKGDYPWELYGLFAALVMLPLFITSFQKYKKKLGMKKWIKVQKFAYLAYFLTYIHLVLVSTLEHQILYTVIFGFYSVLKVYHTVFEYRPFLRTITAFSVLILSLVVMGNFILSASSVSLDEGTSLLETFTTALDEVTDSTSSIDASSVSDGTYRGTASGFHGDTVIVDVTIEDGVITDIDLIDCGCTGAAHGVNFVSVANSIINTVISTQSTDIDTYSGATYTSNGVLNAIEDALESYQNS